MYDDSADSAVFESLFAAMYRSHPVRIPIAGSVASIADITSDTLYACHKAFYAPQNLMLCVEGDVDPELIVRLAAAHTPDVTPVSMPARSYGADETMDIPQPRVESHMEVSMPTFAIGFKCVPAKTPDEAALQELVGDLAAEILAGESSALYQKLYDANVIDADFSADFETMKNLSILEASGDSDTPEAILDALLQEAERIVREGVDEVHLARLKKSMLGRRTRMLDAFEGTCYRMCASHFAGIEYLDYPQLFRRVDAEAVRQFLMENVTRERACISIIYPNEN